MTDITAKPFDWNDNLSKEALEDFEGIRKDLPYCTCQSIGMALTKLELLEKQGCKAIDPSGSSSENPNKCEGTISREAAIRIAEKGQIQGYEWQFKELNRLPPVAPQPKMGRWVEEIISVGTRKVFCSECGCSVPFEHVSNGDVYSASGYGVITKTKFCPNCGTRMLEPQESEEKPSWLGKNCKDCGNEKCKKLGTLPKGYDCALWRAESEV